MSKQLLHLVFGGELSSLDTVEFRDLTKAHFVGLYPNYAKAHEAWKSAAQASVDNAHMRYFVVHLHRLLDPDEVHEHEDHEAELPMPAARAKPKAKPKMQAAAKAKPRPAARGKAVGAKGASKAKKPGKRK